MAVTPIAPITIPAKTLDKFWLKEIRISSPNVNGEASALIAMVPYNDAGQSSNEITALNITGISAKALANPDSNIAKAMYFLIAAIDDEYKLQNQP